LIIPEDYKFAKTFDWKSDLKLWEEKLRKSDPVNPIIALLIWAVGELLWIRYQFPWSSKFQGLKLGFAMLQDGNKVCDSYFPIDI
jgi:hypothetical protein